MRRWRVKFGRAITAFAVVVGSIAPAWAAVRPRPTAALAAPLRFRLGQSVGSPTDGRLLGGSRLDEAPYLRLLPVYANDDARWGLGSLVALVDRAARAVRRQFPDAVLSVGQLSRRGGGDIDRHASHESGRDADLSFYIRGQTNHPLFSDHMVSFRGDGTAPSWPGAFFDDAKNWALVASIAGETRTRVTYIFVAAPLRARLLAYAAHIGAPIAVRNRAAELMVQPRGSLPHDDHFHVRIGCPSGMTGCIELPTRPKASRNALASNARPSHGRAAAAPPTKSSAPPKALAVHPVAPSAPPEPSPIPPPPDDDLAPKVTSAVLATPFDDVDGPAEPAPSPEHGEIR